jgi:hypothetical protein
MTDAKPDMLRHHQNNLAHVRSIYLSAVRMVPKEVAVSDLAKLIEEVKALLEVK